MSCQLPSQLWKHLPTNRHSSSRCCQQSNEKSQNRDWNCRLRLSHSKHMLQLLSAYLRESQFILLERMDYLWHLATEHQAFHPAVPGVIMQSWGVGERLRRGEYSFPKALIVELFWFQIIINVSWHITTFKEISIKAWPPGKAMFIQEFQFWEALFP